MLVVMDYFSRYPEVEIVSSTSATESITRWKKIMATHGLIRELRTDNGPPFNSQEWAEYLQSKNTKHRRITPRWPQANGEVERFMRTLLKVVRIPQAERQNIERALYSFLAEYRLTPHSTIGVSPSELCIGRAVEDTIPHHPSWGVMRNPYQNLMRPGRNRTTKPAADVGQRDLPLIREFTSS